MLLYVFLAFLLCVSTQCNDVPTDEGEEEAARLGGEVQDRQVVENQPSGRDIGNDWLWKVNPSASVPLGRLVVRGQSGRDLQRDLHSTKEDIGYRGCHKSCSGGNQIIETI